MVADGIYIYIHIYWDIYFSSKKAQMLGKKKKRNGMQ